MKRTVLAVWLLASVTAFAKPATPERTKEVLGWAATLDRLWRSDTLDPHDTSLLERAVRRAYGKCEDEPSEFAYSYSTADLPKLGRVALVQLDMRCQCGGTGNCAIHVFAKRRRGYRELPFANDAFPFGGSHGVLHSPAGPELVFSAHMSASTARLTVYRWNGKAFEEHDSACIVRKSPDTAEQQVTDCAE